MVSLFRLNFRIFGQVIARFFVSEKKTEAFNKEYCSITRDIISFNSQLFGLSLGVLSPTYSLPSFAI